MPHQDPHSCYRPDSPFIRHIDFDLVVDFERQVLDDHADYHFSAPLNDVLELDTRDLQIRRISAPGDPSRDLEWQLTEPNFMGSVLRIEDTRGLTRLRIEFSTSPSAAALQWLAPEQTSGKRHPFMFSQCQAILARTVFPCQDSPGVRFTYDATLRVPRGLAAVMAAQHMETVAGADGTVCRFHMRHPIPSYLFALAVGNIVAEKIGPRSRVFAEPEVVKSAAREFAEVNAMITGAERLFGEYVWDEFNLLVMPPSFPYGGMENPTLTFLTPTLIAGDRSLVSVVAHELAHSWTGNLVTNATWEDFWLNEGWTVYAERRILEELYGTDLANLQAVSGRNDLMTDFKNLGENSAYTKLKTELAGMDPDDVYSSVPYEKGFLLLVAVERVVGRAAFDEFLRGYIRDFAFTSLRTDQFVEYLLKRLPDAAKKVNLDSWIHQPGLPESAPSFASRLIDDVRAARKLWDAGKRDLSAIINAWNIDQKILFLEELPPELPHADCQVIERLFAADRTGNCEILLNWYRLAARSSYSKAYPGLREFLSAVGRGKYLKPLYRALHENPSTRSMASELFEQFKDRYHSVARNAVSRILAA